MVGGIIDAIRHKGENSAW